jgi:hypothetical protein
MSTIAKPSSRQALKRTRRSAATAAPLTTSAVVTANIDAVNTYVASIEPQLAAARTWIIRHLNSVSETDRNRLLRTARRLAHMSRTLESVDRALAVIDPPPAS